MINRGRLHVSVITASCTALAVLGIGSGALASTHATSTSQIKACYSTKTSLPALDHIATTGKCPSGDSTLTWNKVGPRGPAGVSKGISTSSSTGVALDTGVNNFTTVLTTPAAPTAGTYYVNTTIMAYVAQGDGVDCILGDAQGFPGIFADDDPVAGSGFQTLPLDQAVPLTAGETVSVYCGDYTANSSTAFYDGSITGSLINTATGDVAQPNLTTHHPVSPRR